MRLTTDQKILGSTPGWPEVYFQSFPGGSDVKASACNAGDLGSIPGLGRSPGEGNGNPLQYSCLENPMDRGAWWATVHGVAKSRTRLSDFTFTATTDITRWGPFTRPIKHTYSDPGHKYEFSLKVTQAQPEEATFQSKNVNSRLLGRIGFQLWVGFIWLIPGSGHLSLKAPQSGNN